MFRVFARCARSILCVAAVLLSVLPAGAQIAPADVLAGKTIRWIIASGPNSTTDNLARGLIEGMKASLPRTTILTQNIGTSAVALVEAEAARGDAIVLVAAQISFDYGQMLGTEAFPTDLSRFKWIGGLTNNERIVGLRPGLGVDTMEDLAGLDRTLMAPVRGATTAGAIEAQLIASIFGLDLNIVSDVDENLTNTLFLAGDADFIVSNYRSLKPLIDAGALTPLMRLGEAGYPSELEALPTLAQTVPAGTPPEIVEIVDSLNRLARVVMAVPDTDPGDLQALRAVFDQVVVSEALAAFYGSHGLILAPTPGAEVEARMELLLGDSRSHEVLRSYFK
jgi:tripartite-type tricarboxylate transporter receptor subunit TctC